METKSNPVELISDFHCERCPCDADVFTTVGKGVIPVYLCADCAIQMHGAHLEAVFIAMGGTTELYEDVVWDVVTEADELIGFSANEIEIDGVLIEIKRVGINKVKGAM